MSASPLPPRQRAPAIIQQVALIMLALCLIVPVVLYLGAQRGTARLYEPVETRAAIDALLAAIAPAGVPLAPTPQADELGRLLPECTGLPAYQGLPIMEDLAEQLSLLDQQLARLTAAAGVRNAPLRLRYQLRTAIWAQAVTGGRVGCQHAARALRLLAGPRGTALLAQAQWQESATTPARRVPGTASVQLAENSLAQADPWRGWPGCIWLGGLQKDSTAYYLAPTSSASWSRSLCAQDGIRPANAKSVAAARAPAMQAPPTRDDPTWAIPHDLGVLIGELDALRLPQGKLYLDYASQLPDRANRRTVGRNEIDVGFNVQLTIDPRIQAIAQQVATCYTGQTAACAQSGIAFDQVGAAQGTGAAAMWERAAARMAAVAVVDVATGRIEALASAHTPCFAQENDGPFRDAACLPLWTAPRRRPDALLNHAVFSDFLPGSTIKPILASVFFEDAANNADQLARWLATSNTDRFNDELFCLTASSSSPCDRPARVQQRAADLGWNTDCSTQPSRRCARIDILFGRRLSAGLDSAGAEDYLRDTPLQRGALGGRLFVTPAASGSGAGDRLMPLPEINRSAPASCRDARGAWHASNCSASAMKPLVNEAEGQGQARTTALGLAAMLTRLTAAANGLPAVPAPHLVERISDAQGNTVATMATRDDGAATVPLARAETTLVRADIAQRVLRALARGSQPEGTGHLICLHVFGKRCAAVAPRMAGKTGTPTFSFDQLSFTQARQRCVANPRDDACREKPVKLYVAAVMSDSGKDRYDKVIAVITERNWYLPDHKLVKERRERVHGGTNDLDNVSTEIAMRIVGAAWAQKQANP